jgi:hypothetical protein
LKKRVEVRLDVAVAEYFETNANRHTKVLLEQKKNLEVTPLVDENRANCFDHSIAHSPECRVTDITFPGRLSDIDFVPVVGRSVF